MKTLILLGFLIPTICNAQSYSISSDKAADGGGTSTGGVYSDGGTVGQHDASASLTGGIYSLLGGFWSLFAVQTPGAPLLTIICISNQAIVSWNPSVTGWTLQTSNNLCTGIWGNYPGQIVNNSAINSPPEGNVFFRLEHQ